MRFGSLFSGIGGLDLGLERAGMTCAWQCEIDPWCRQVLEKHWPNVPRYGDVKELNVDQFERVDLVAGGFPCQPVSLAGARKAQKDERWLWPFFADVLRVLRPRFALLENVPGLLTAGFDDILANLAALGYDAEWDCIPAAFVGAPHLRYRVFVVAHAGSESVRDESGRGDGTGRAGAPVARHDGSPQPLADTEGRQQSNISSKGLRDSVARRHGQRERHLPGTSGGTEPENSPPRVYVDNRIAAAVARPSSMADANGTGPQGRFFHREGTGQCPIGASGEPYAEHWRIEPDVGRVAHGVPRRVDRLRGLGNAVVPQVAEYVGRQIMASS